MADPSRERAFMSQWLAGTLAPGDRLVAGVRAVTGPSPYLDLPWVLLAVAGLVVGWRDLFYTELSHAVEMTYAALTFAGATVTLVLAARRKSTYLAVTERQLVAVQMRGRNNPVQVLFSTPVSAAQLTTREGSLLPLHTVWCSSEDGSPLSFGGKARDRVRLTIKGRRAVLGDILTAVRLHGGAVERPAPSLHESGRDRSDGGYARADG